MTELSTPEHSSPVVTLDPSLLDRPPRPRARPVPASIAFVVIFLIALLARLPGLGEATTEDEDQWILRAGGFSRALASGQMRSTFQIGHPGVTTMWLVDLALGRVRSRAFGDLTRNGLLVTQAPDFLPALHQARLPFVVVNTLLVVVNAALARRLLGPGPALIGGLLLALAPYWAAMSPIVGMDGLLAGLMAASLQCSLLAFVPRPGGQVHRWALASGLFAGLAALTKATGLFMIPFVGLLGLELVWRAAGGWRGLAKNLRGAGPPLRVVAARCGFWLVGLAISGALWPALWADPLSTLRRATEFIRSTASTPHVPPNYFLGQPVLDPGQLFYPVALLLHLGPGTTIGLVALALLGRSWNRPVAVGPLLDFVVLLLVALTLSPKKVDRYVLPALLPLDLLAGLGWWLVVRWLVQRQTWGVGAWNLTTNSPLGRSSALLVPLLVALLQVWPLLGAGPHPLSAYNPLVGGIRTAEWALPVGWGEGLDTVGAYLAEQPNADQLQIGIWFPLWINFQAHTPGTVHDLAFAANGTSDLSNPERLRTVSSAGFAQLDYYVDYIHAHQRRLIPRQLDDRQPDFVVIINGAVYARVYRLKP